MTKAEARNRVKISRRLARILEIVANTPGVSMIVQSQIENVKFIGITFPDREPLKAAYIIGQRSDSLEKMEADLNEIVQ